LYISIVTLEDAVAEMNRYSDIKLRVDDPALAAERVSGTFAAGEPESFAESLELFLPLRAVRHGQVIMLVPNDR
jgi:transmembrane sensor